MLYHGTRHPFGLVRWTSPLQKAHNKTLRRNPGNTMKQILKHSGIYQLLASGISGRVLVSWPRVCGAPKTANAVRMDNTRLTEMCMVDFRKTKWLAIEQTLGQDMSLFILLPKINGKSILSCWQLCLRSLSRFLSKIYYLSCAELLQVNQI